MEDLQDLLKKMFGTSTTDTTDASLLSDNQTKKTLELMGLLGSPEALTGFLARYGGSMRKFQTGAQTSVPGFSSDMPIDPYSMWGLNQNNIAVPQQPQQYNVAKQSLNTTALTETPDNMGGWSDDRTN